MSAQASSQSEPELPLATTRRVGQANLVVNASVVLEPEGLSRAVEPAVESACRSLGVQPIWLEKQSFRPGRPVPTH